jgi:TfoX/Sxy family transcriptional regulator of competence genes
MAAEYLERLRSMILGASPEVPEGTALVFKHFFGGAALYADGRICLTLTPVGLALKLPEPFRAQLIRDGAKPLRYFPDGPIKKDYVVAPPSLLESEERLKFWAEASIGHVLSLPEAGRRPKGRGRT